MNRYDPSGLQDEPPRNCNNHPEDCQPPVNINPGGPNPDPQCALYKQPPPGCPVYVDSVTGNTGIIYHNINNDAAKLGVIDKRKKDLQSRLGSDQDCMNWLVQTGTSGGVLEFSTLTVTEAERFEKDGRTANEIAASTRDVPGWDIIINGQGAFFYGGEVPSANGSFSGIVGNSVSGQLFILLHELAHITGASGISQNDGDPRVNARNNDEVYKHCQKTILGQ